ARRLAPRYGFGIWPALVFLRDGGYVGVIEGMRNWQEYRREVAAMLDRPVRRAPVPGAAVRAEGVAGTCHRGIPP
ncbi:MAG: hydrogenase, partial [Rhodocyclales bacterium CG17_big_fil_post_rev_8_21_14_2_50_68_7]